MAYPLYGHELDLAHDPLEAGLERFLAFGAGFIGEEALAASRAQGPERCLVGVLVESKVVPRPGYGISDGGPIGIVTSGTFSPSIERSIAIGYVPAAYAEPGKRVHVEVRGRPVPGQITATPFYDPKQRNK
jgi:aminomethyltransferase